MSTAEISARVVEMTPKLASEILAGKAPNRRVRPRKVDMYVGAMKRGEWRLNGEPVILDTAGALIDGQHRLSAVVKSGITVAMLLVEGAAPDAIHTIDTGAARMASDVLKLNGVRNANNVAAAFRVLAGLALGKREGRGYAITNPQALRFVELMPDFEDHVSAFIGCSAFRRMCPSMPQVVALTFLLKKAGDRNARTKIDGFIDGLCGKSGSVGDPAYALRDRWVDFRLRAAKGEKPTQLRTMTALVRAWNFHYSGVTVTKVIAGVRKGATVPQTRGIRKTSLEAFARSVELMD